jgi:hypothetical protein
VPLPSQADTTASPETLSSTIATPSRHKLSSLEELLAEALAGELHEAGPRERLDLLYLQILMKASSDMGLYSDQHHRQVLEIVASLVLVKEPLPTEVIARLVDKPQTLLDCLEPLLRDQHHGTVALLHPSFVDFVMDPKRCTNLSYPTDNPSVAGVSFLVLPEEHHRRLACQCLAIMNTHLQRNIGRLEKPWIPNVEIIDLSKTLDSCASIELQYACKFWAFHLSKPGEPESTLLDELDKFCRGHLLHWLELLSLMGALPTVENYLPDALDWCQVRSYSASQQNHELTSFCRHISFRLISWKWKPSSETP